MNENNNMNNNVSLSSLSNGAIPTASPMGMPLPKFKSDEVKDVNKRAVALPPESERPVEGLGNPMIDQAFQNLDSTIDRLQEETNQIYEEGQEQRIEKELDEDDEISVKEDNNTYKVIIMIIIHHLRLLIMMTIYLTRLKKKKMLSLKN